MSNGAVDSAERAGGHLASTRSATLDSKCHWVPPRAAICVPSGDGQVVDPKRIAQRRQQEPPTTPPVNSHLSHLTYQPPHASHFALRTSHYEADMPNDTASVVIPNCLLISMYTHV